MNRFAVTCDDVFEVLTSGSFPRVDPAQGFQASIVAEDTEIELHLAACHECRRLAEALRPAVRLIDEAVQELDADLPAYRGALPLPHHYSSHPQAPNRQRSGARRIDGVWKCLAALALGVGLISLFQFADANDRRARKERGARPASASVGDSSDAPTAASFAKLSSLGLPIACLMPGGERRLEVDRPAVGATNRKFACCMGCHAPSNAARPPVDALAVLVDSCLACHTRP